MARPSKVTPELLDRIVFMYKWETDMTLDEIANITNVSIATVKRVLLPLKRNGTLKGRGRTIDDSVAEQVMYEYFVLDKPRRYLGEKYKLYPYEFQRLTHEWKDKYPAKKTGRRPKKPPAQQ